MVKEIFTLLCKFNFGMTSETLKKKVKERVLSFYCKDLWTVVGGKSKRNSTSPLCFMVLSINESLDLYLIYLELFADTWF